MTWRRRMAMSVQAWNCHWLWNLKIGSLLAPCLVLWFICRKQTRCFQFDRNMEKVNGCVESAKSYQNVQFIVVKHLDLDLSRMSPSVQPPSTACTLLSSWNLKLLGEAQLCRFSKASSFLFPKSPFKERMPKKCVCVCVCVGGALGEFRFPKSSQIHFKLVSLFLLFVILWIINEQVILWTRWFNSPSNHAPKIVVLLLRVEAQSSICFGPYYIESPNIELSLRVFIQWGSCTIFLLLAA